jgi:UDP-glucose 4-epimerase
MKRTVVIGGGGFIGIPLVKALCKSGRNVTVLGRRPTPSDEIPSDCSYVSGDYGNRAILREVLTPDCEVIDLAYSTVPKTSYGNPVFDILSNLPASVGLLEEASEIRVGKVVLVSSGGTVYGPAQYLPIDENHPTEPISPYGITKLTTDRYAIMFHLTKKLPVAVARPANAFGSRQKANTGQGFIAAAIDAILCQRAIEIYGETGAIRDYIHVDDVARGIMSVLESGAVGRIYNIGTGVGTSNSSIVESLRSLADGNKMEVRVNHLPKRSYDVDSNILDSTRLYEDSGWRPQISLSDGLSEMWNAALGGRL